MEQSDRIEAKVDQALMVQGAQGETIQDIKKDLAVHIHRTNLLEGIVLSWKHRLMGVLAIFSAFLVAGKHLLELVQRFLQP